MFFILFGTGLMFFLFLAFNVHCLIFFMGLELMLLLIFMFFVVGVFYSGSFSFFLLFLLVSICLGGFSISFLVNFVRGYGRDYWETGLVS